jgi:proteic killer suppression protein
VRVRVVPPPTVSPVIQSFAGRGTEDLFSGQSTRAARAVCPERIWAVARRKLDYLDSAVALADLRQPSGNRLEALRGDRRGQHSIRINDQYRIRFVWTSQGPSDVTIVEYH